MRLADITASIVGNGLTTAASTPPATTQQQNAKLEAVARTDNVSVTDAVREAINAHIEAHHADRDFQARIKRMLKEEQTVLRELAK